MEWQKKHWYGWALIPFIWVIYLVNVGFPMYGDVIANAVMVNEMGIDRGIYGIGSSIYNISVGLLGPVAGFFMAKRGARSSYYLGSSMLLVSSLLLAFWVDNGWKFIFVYGILSGNASLFAASLTCDFLVCQWHVKRRGIALGLVATAAGMGSLIASPIVAFICNNYGWRQCWVLVAFLSVFCLVVERVFIVNKPEDLGQTVDGYTWPEKLRSGREGAQPKSRRVKRTTYDWQFSEIMRQPSTYFILLGILSYYMVYVLIMSHGVLLLFEKGFEATHTAVLLSAIGVSGMVGRILCGYLADKVQPRFVWLITAAGVLLGAYNLLVAADTASIMSAASLIGLGFGGSFVLVPNVISNYYGGKNYSRVYGTLLPVVTIVSGLVPSFSGFLFDTYGNYDLAFKIVIGIAACCLIGILLARQPEDPVPQDGAAAEDGDAELS